MISFKNMFIRVMIGVALGVGHVVILHMIARGSSLHPQHAFDEIVAAAQQVREALNRDEDTLFQPGQPLTSWANDQEGEMSAQGLSDKWSRAFRVRPFEVSDSGARRTSGSEFSFCVISMGENGLFENGDGDDLAVRVTKSSIGAMRVNIGYYWNREQVFIPIVLLFGAVMATYSWLWTRSLGRHDDKCLANVTGLSVICVVFYTLSLVGWCLDSPKWGVVRLPPTGLLLSVLFSVLSMSCAAVAAGLRGGVAVKSCH